jgi:hypothetical protein
MPTMFSRTAVTKVVSLWAWLMHSAISERDSSVEQAPTVDPGLRNRRTRQGGELYGVDGRAILEIVQRQSKLFTPPQIVKKAIIRLLPFVTVEHTSNQSALEGVKKQNRTYASGFPRFIR